MSKVYENAKDYLKDSKGIACEKIREELKQCLLESDCVMKVVYLIYIYINNDIYKDNLI